MTHKLPKHIADLCGILEDGLVGRSVGRGSVGRSDDRSVGHRSPIQSVANPDRSVTVTYFGQEIGRMIPAKMAGRDATHWIATSLHGDVKRCFSETHARNWIVEQSH
jgi:hypothetical protein